MSKILVTGGAGFIGSHLVKKLLSEGNEVTVVDVKVGLDILDENTDHLFKGIDTVFHLAALTRPRESFVNPIETTRVNVEGTLRVLMNCQKNGVKKFIFVSSASVYGHHETYPLIETAILNSESPYALTKLVGEQFCELYQKLSDMQINCVRPFNVYGKGQNPDGEYAAAVPKFIEALKLGNQPYITGDGKQFRDFVYVEDVVDLLVKLSNSDIEGETFNAGSGKKTSINALYETICGLMKKEMEPRYIETVNDPNTLASIEKAERLLSWRPSHSLIEGLIKTI